MTLSDAAGTSAREIAVVHLFELPSKMANVVQTVATAAALAKTGRRTRLFVRAAGTLDVEAHLAEHHGVEPTPLLVIDRFPASKGAAGMLLRARLARLAAARRPPLFLSRSQRFARLLLATRKVVGRRGPLLHEFHNLEHVVLAERGDDARAAERVERLRASEARVAAGADGLIAISQPLADDLRAAFRPSAPLVVIEDGVDFERLRGAARARPTTGGAHLVYAGSFFPHKGVESLVRSLVELPAGVTLELVGGHPEAELERLRRIVAEDPVLRERVTFAGAVAAVRVAEHLARADAIVLPSGRESAAERYTSPLKLFEAMASGAPIVCAPAAALTSVVRDGETAIVAPSGEPAGLAAGVRAVLADPGRALAIGRRAMDAAAAFDWARRAERIAAFADEVEASFGRRG